MSARTEIGAAANAATGGRPDGLSLLLGLPQAGPIIILVTLVAVFGLLAPHFVSVRNLQNLLAQSAIVCALGLGEFLVILVRGIDVSVGSVIALSVVTVATLTGVDEPNSAAQIALYPLIGLAVETSCTFTGSVRFPDALEAGSTLGMVDAVLAALDKESPA